MLVKQRFKQVLGEEQFSLKSKSITLCTDGGWRLYLRISSAVHGHGGPLLII